MKTNVNKPKRKLLQVNLKINFTCCFGLNIPQRKLGKLLCVQDITTTVYAFNQYLNNA